MYVKWRAAILELQNVKEHILSNLHCENCKTKSKFNDTKGQKDFCFWLTFLRKGLIGKVATQFPDSKRDIIGCYFRNSGRGGKRNGKAEKVVVFR
jgi:hypothetical protein